MITDGHPFLLYDRIVLGNGMDINGHICSYMSLYGHWGKKDFQDSRLSFETSIPQRMRPGDGKPKKARHLNIEDAQYETLNALAKLSEEGSPTVSSMVRRAIQDYLDRRFEKDPSLHQKVIDLLGTRKLVPIRGGRNRLGRRGID